MHIYIHTCTQTYVGRNLWSSPHLGPDHAYICICINVYLNTYTQTHRGIDEIYGPAPIWAQSMHRSTQGS